MTASPTLAAWLDEAMTRSPPRAKSLVMTLFGDVVAPRGGAVWLGSLIELLAPFGINHRLVRTSVFRLAEEGWLDARRDGRRSRYALDPRSAARFNRAHQRIYAPADGAWDGSWTLVMANIGPIMAERRASLRKELLWQGYATPAPFVFAHPAPDRATLDDILRRTETADTVFVCAASQVDQVSGRPLAELVEECWELGGLADDHARFIAEFTGLADALDAAGGDATPQQAFVARMLAIHAYRRLKLQDPQLPPSLLPLDWPGQTAFALCRRIYRATCEGAERHIETVLRKEDAAAPGVEPWFRDRFGGLG